MQIIDKQVFEPVQRLIAYFGTQELTASALNVRQGTVSGWLKCRHKVSELNALKAEKLTNGAVKAYELCPTLIDLYNEDTECL